MTTCAFPVGFMKRGQRASFIPNNLFYPFFLRDSLAIRLKEKKPQQNTWSCNFIAEAKTNGLGF